VGHAAMLLSEWFAISWHRSEEGTTVWNVDTCSPISTVSHLRRLNHQQPHILCSLGWFRAPASEHQVLIAGVATKVLRYPLTSPSSAKVRNEWSLPPPLYSISLHAQGQLYLLPFFLQTGRAEILVNGNQIKFNITSW